MFGEDPGDCIVCGAAHCACGGGPIEIAQLPARDAAAARARGLELRAEIVQATLPPGQFTTATYLGKKKRGPAAAK
jgi:hypothetical protein